MKLVLKLKSIFSYNISWFFTRSLWQKMLLVGVFVGIGWFGIRQMVLGNQQQNITYQTAPAEKGTLITSVTASGIISSAGSAAITTNVSGITKEVYVQNGDIVQQGDPIAYITLDQSSQQKQMQAWASYLSAQNNLNAAKSKMNSLQAALFTASEKFTNGAGTDDPNTTDPQYIIEHAEWLQAEANYTQQADVIKQAEVALSSAWLSYSQLTSTVTAPMAGVVSNMTISPGQMITGSSTTNNSATNATSSSNGTSIGSISLENSTPQATVNLSEIDVTKVALGQKVTLTLDAFPEKTFTGTVDAINTQGTTSSSVTSYPVTITFDTAIEKMYPNMAVSATIITSVKDNVLLVPMSAVTTTNGVSTVRVMNDGNPSAVTVETGSSNDAEIEILSGLNEGDIVVIGQTGGTTQRSTSTTSPFGGTGFGGMRSSGGSSQIRIQTLPR